MMRQLACGAVAAGVLGLAALASGADDPKPTTVKQVMKLHKGANAPLGALKKELGESPPDWADIQKLTKQFGTQGPELVKIDPPKGEKASWEKLAGAYGDTCKDMDAAAKKEDLAGTKAAVGKIGNSCMTCHAAHRPK